MLAEFHFGTSLANCVSHQRYTDVLEIPPFLEKIPPMGARVMKNQSLTDSGLTLDRMVWIQTTDHKVMSLNPETEDITENIRTGFYREKTHLFSFKEPD